MQLGEHPIRRIGRSRAGFSAEKVVPKTTNAEGIIISVVRLKPPRQMTGKSGMDISKASLSEGLGRLVVTVYLQGGLHAASFLRRHRGRNEAFYDTLSGDIPLDALLIKRAKDWVFGQRCCLHATSSATKCVVVMVGGGGLHRWCTEDLLDGANLCISSCRNSSVWCARTPPSTRAIEQSCGWPWVPLRRSWSSCFASTPGGTSTARSCECARSSRSRRLACRPLPLLCHVRAMAELARHAGPAARLFAARLLVGLESLVASVDWGDKNNDRFYLGAVRKRLSGQAQKYNVIGSLAGYPAERLALPLLEDERFLLKAQDLWNDLKREERYVSDLPDEVWSALTGAIAGPGYHGHRLRDDTLAAMWVSTAYVDRNLYAPSRSHPLSLTQGDIEQNRQRFVEVDPSDLDMLCEKIHFCTRFAPGQVQQSLRLPADSPWSIARFEGHATGAFAKRHQRSLGPEHPSSTTRGVCSAWVATPRSMS